MTQIMGKCSTKKVPNRNKWHGSRNVIGHIYSTFSIPISYCWSYKNDILILFYIFFWNHGPKNTYVEVLKLVFKTFEFILWWFIQIISFSSIKSYLLTPHIAHKVVKLSGIIIICQLTLTKKEYQTNKWSVEI